MNSLVVPQSTHQVLLFWWVYDHGQSVQTTTTILINQCNVLEYLPSYGWNVRFQFNEVLGLLGKRICNFLQAIRSTLQPSNGKELRICWTKMMSKDNWQCSVIWFLCVPYLRTFTFHL